MFDCQPPCLRAGAFAAESRWRPRRLLRAGALPPPVTPWLLDTASLTRRLRARCPGCFSVRVLGQRRERPDFNERRLLGMRDHELALIRQVELLCGGRPWVFARTVIPLATLQGECRRLGRLGSRPLGATLFASRSMRRFEVQVARVGPGEALFDAATSRLARRPAAVWGRRSVFHLDDKPLLVSELFLPALVGLPSPTAPRASDSIE